MNRLWRLDALSAALATLATALTLGGSAHAASSYCRSDPTVTLSNGKQVQMWADTNTDVSQISGVYYTLHVPRGVTVKGVAYDSYGYLEHLTVVADQSGSQYMDTTTVYLTSGKSTFSANAIRMDGTTAAMNGATGSTVTLHWAT